MGISYQEKQSIDMNKYEQPTGTLATTFYKFVSGTNKYTQFKYVPQKIFKHNQGQVSVSMNNYPINANKNFNNKQHKDKK